MERRTFGDGVPVSVLGIGCSRVGSVNNPVPMREIEATLEAAVEAGVNLFDTADIYGQGDSERTLARLLRRHRDRLFVVTKVGGRHGRHAGMIRLAKPLLRVLVRSRPHLRSTVVKLRTASVSQNFVPAELALAVDASRRRLGLDRLHGLLLHSPSPETLRDPAIADFLAASLQSGRVARVGAAIDTVEALEAALSLPAITMLQVPVAFTVALARSPLLDGLRARKIAVFVREILRRSDAGTDDAAPRLAAIPAAIAPDFVTAAIIGLSTRRHLAEVLSVLT